ncbi:hypothetical protein ABAC460_16365 [Asticcacaulis sp. AC460]|nr:hypothetical protein ABAC460_16365 [Asticcacaulis sp. AC460]
MQSLLCQPFVPLGITLLSFITMVITAVDLDDQLCSVTIKVQDIGTEGLLTAKHRIADAASLEPLPKKMLWQSRSTPQMSS